MSFCSTRVAGGSVRAGLRYRWQAHLPVFDAR